MEKEIVRLYDVDRDLPISIVYLVKNQASPLYSIKIPKQTKSLPAKVAGRTLFPRDGFGYNNNYSIDMRTLDLSGYRMVEAVKAYKRSFETNKEYMMVYTTWKFSRDFENENTKSKIEVLKLNSVLWDRCKIFLNDDNLTVFLTDASSEIDLTKTTIKVRFDLN